MTLPSRCRPPSCFFLFFLSLIGGRGSENVFLVNKHRLRHRLHPLLMGESQELSPDDAWLNQYRKLAENTMINDLNTLAGGSAVLPSPEEQQRIMRANLDELASVSKKLNVTISSPTVAQSQSVGEYLSASNNMNPLKGVESFQGMQYQVEYDGDSNSDGNNEDGDFISQYIESVVETAQKAEDSGNMNTTSNVDMNDDSSDRTMKGGYFTEEVDDARARFLKAIEDFEGPSSSGSCPKCKGPMGNEEFQNWGKCSLCRQSELAEGGPHINRQYQAMSSPSSSSSIYRSSNDKLQEIENSYAADPQQYADPTKKYKSAPTPLPTSSAAPDKRKVGIGRQPPMKSTLRRSSASFVPPSSQLMNRDTNSVNIGSDKRNFGSPLLKINSEYNKEDGQPDDDGRGWDEYMGAMEENQELSLENLAYRLTHQDREIERLKVLSIRAVDVEHRLDKVIVALEEAEDKTNQLYMELNTAHKKIQLLEEELDKKANKKNATKGKKTSMSADAVVAPFDDTEVSPRQRHSDDIIRAFSQSPEYKRKKRNAAS